MGDTTAIVVSKPILPSASARQPSEEVIERAVLHHHDDDVVNAGAIRRRQLGLGKKRCDVAQREGTSGAGSNPDKFTTGKVCCFRDGAV